MSTILLAAYLLLVGVMSLVSTQIPQWVVGALAVAAGLALGAAQLSGKAK